MQKFHSITTQTKLFFSRIQKKLGYFIDTWPFASFIGLLGLLLALVIIGNVLRKPAVEPAPAPSEPKKVQVYQNGTNPSVTLAAKVEKAGVITVLAQSSGIVQKINVHEGEKVKKAETLVSLSTNYQGGNAQAVSRQIAQRNASFNNETFNLQKETIAKQREAAEKLNTQSAELREISRRSVSETSDLINFNEGIINDINKNLTALKEANNNNPDDFVYEPQFLQLNQAKSGVEAGLLNLRASLRNSQYTSSDTNTPAQLAEITKEITLKQLDIQEKSVGLSKDVANLNVKLARISELLMYPATPCPGVVERVFVHVGDNVSPGTPIAVVRADTREVTAVVAVSSDLARQVSRIEPSTFSVNGKTIAVVPRYVSLEPTEGVLHSVLYSIPAEFEADFVDNQDVTVQVPVGTAPMTQSEQFVPLDAVFQTQDKAFVYVAQTENGETRARVKTVQLGTVSGQYVQVLSGLDTSDVVIVTRGVSDGDKVTIQQN